MKLFSRVLGQTGSPMVILHGLFGMSDNWLTLGRRWAEEHRVHLLDQRNHGQSPDSDEWTYLAMAGDVGHYIEEELGEAVHLVGHSMGGKTAMCLATERPDLLKSLTVIDIGPKAYPVHHRGIVDALKAVPVEVLSRRSEVNEALAKGIPQSSVRQFLMKSLHRCSSGGFEWRFNLDVIDRELENVGWELPEEAEYPGPTLFIRGGKSGYILDDDLPAIHRQFPLMEFESVAVAGHWVHAERPDALHDLLRSFMQRND